MSCETFMMISDVEAIIKVLDKNNFSESYQSQFIYLCNILNIHYGMRLRSLKI